MKIQEETDVKEYQIRKKKSREQTVSDSFDFLPRYLVSMISLFCLFDKNTSLFLTGFSPIIKTEHLNHKGDLT